jgi:hypothetical protein
MYMQQQTPFREDKANKPSSHAAQQHQTHAQCPKDQVLEITVTEGGPRPTFRLRPAHHPMQAIRP